MEPHIDVITLAVRDLDRALEFYRDGLGLESAGVIGTEFTGDETNAGGAAAMFRLRGGLTLALYPRTELAKDANVPVEPPKTGEFSIGHVVANRADVDAVLAQAEAAGATLTDQAYERPWGIYSGYFRDLDGHLWEVIWKPRARGRTQLIIAVSPRETAGTYPSRVPYALVVLGSSRSNRTGAYTISRACRRIVAHAARLAEIRTPELVVFSGWAPDGGASEAEQMLALWRGPEVELVLEVTASTTAENAARTLPLVLERGIAQAVVVSTPLHTYRARWFFEQLYSAQGIATSFETPRLLPTPSALIWEVGALTARGRHLRAAEAELEREQLHP